MRNTLQLQAVLEYFAFTAFGIGPDYAKRIYAKYFSLLQLHFGNEVCFSS